MYLKIIDFCKFFIFLCLFFIVPTAVYSKPITPPLNVEVEQPSSISVFKILDSALDLLGTPYIYGEMSRRIGLDCSGFVKLIFKTVGVYMPRTVTKQIKFGVPVKKQNLQPGDIIYFRGRGLNSEFIDHIGIYLGGGDFIHAERKAGVVRIDNLHQNSYYSKTFAGARRISK